MLPDLPALTVRQPWAWAIAHGGKTVENRTWRTRHRGLLAIHAGARVEDETAFAAVAGMAATLPPRWWREPGTLPTSAIVAVADLHDITRGSDSRWALPGQWHWLLGDVRSLAEPVPCVGARGLWELLPSDRDQVLRQVTP